MKLAIYDNGFPIGSINKTYITKFVDPEKDYDVDYWMDAEGNKHRERKLLKGKDLTQNQILQLFIREAL